MFVNAVREHCSIVPGIGFHRYVSSLNYVALSVLLDYKLVFLDALIETCILGFRDEATVVGVQAITI